MTTPERAWPYSASNVPEMTWTSCNTLRSSVTVDVLLNGLFTDTPSTWNWTSPSRPPRKWPSTTPACKFTMSPSSWTGSASIWSRVMVASVLVWVTSTTGCSAVTTTSSPVNVSSWSVTSSSVVVLDRMSTPSTTWDWYPMLDTRTETVPGGIRSTL